MEEELNKSPDNWDLRFEYARFLESTGMINEYIVQQYMANNLKCPGPPCVQESEWSEATWFVTGKELTRWGFPHFVEANIVHPCWCLPLDIFNRLEGFITLRRDNGHHNKWAKSWPSRAQAEAALLIALQPKRKYRSIDD